jgi:hypothetical protein
LLVAVALLTGLLLAVSLIRRPPAPAVAMPPAELACQDVVEAVTDYLDDALSPERRDELDRHLVGCDGCTEYIGQIRATVDGLGVARPAPVAPDH